MWTIEKREPYGDAGPGHLRPSRWVPWRPAIGRTWDDPVAAMRWAMVAAEHAPDDPEATARFAASPADHVRWAWRSTTTIYGGRFRLVRARATVRRVTRRGRLPAADAAARLSLAREILARQPTINGAALAAELSATLGVEPPIAASEGLRMLVELRAVGDAPPPAGVAADGRELARPIVGAAPRYRLRPETVARLAAVTGRPIGEDVDGQVVAVMDELERLKP